MPIELQPGARSLRQRDAVWSWQRMTVNSALVAFVLALGLPFAAHAQPGEPNDGRVLQVVLLGTASGPSIQAQRLGIATLIRAGSEQLLFDVGRGVTTGMARLAITPADVTKIFLTHLHSDHLVGLPELHLFPWASQGRSAPLQLWGPDGTRAMAQHLEQAFSFDIRTRRDVDEKFPADGIRIVAIDIQEGIVYDASGVRVTAFLVDHSPVAPAFGYRIDYGGRSVVLSGDTKPSDNLIEHAEGVDVLVHEVGRWKQDPVLQGPPDELLPGSRQTRGRARTIADHHTDGVEAGRVFARINPKLALFSHYNVDPAATLSLVRQNYAGEVRFGEDLMTIDIGDEVTVRPFAASQ
jgi:ribonuclease Z